MSSEVERFSSGGRWEAAYGYSRAVRAGGFVFVAGCTGVDASGEVVPGGAAAQMRQACANVEAALALAGASLAQVVQTRMFVRDINLADEVGRVHGEIFGAFAPVSTMVEIAWLIDQRMLVEVEAVAFAS